MWPLVLVQLALPAVFGDTSPLVLNGRLPLAVPAEARCEGLPLHAPSAGGRARQPRCTSHLQVGKRRHFSSLDKEAVHNASTKRRREGEYADKTPLGLGERTHVAESSVSMLFAMAGSVLGDVAARDFNPFVEVEPGSIPHIWGHDVFPERRHSHPNDGDEGLNFFTAAPKREWCLLGSLAILLGLLDAFVLQRMPNTFHVHLIGICFWLVIAFLFNLHIWSSMGERKALEWCAGYVLEWMLSLDNLFVFHLIFQTYQTPPEQARKAVFVGVVGAILMRMLFFMVVSTLLHVFHWIRIPFGLLLVWSGIEAARGNDDDLDVSDTTLVRGLKWCLGSSLVDRYDEDGCRLCVWESGRCQITLLFVVVACLEFTDIVFALDSVSAKVAQIPDQYIAFSSSVLAMFGLRAMFFVMQDLVEMFDLLQYGLCIILVFIGAELLLSQYIHLAASVVCVLILSVFVCCIVGSIAKQHFNRQSTACES